MITKSHTPDGLQTMPTFNANGEMHPANRAALRALIAAKKYAARINPHTFFAVIVRIEPDGSEHVVLSGKHYASMVSAERASARRLARIAPPNQRA